MTLENVLDPRMESRYINPPSPPKGTIVLFQIFGFITPFGINMKLCNSVYNNTKPFAIFVG